MNKIRSFSWLILTVFLFVNPYSMSGQTANGTEEDKEGASEVVVDQQQQVERRRIVEPRRRSVLSSIGLFPIRVLHFPFQMVGKGMEKGLILSEKHYAIQRLNYSMLRLSQKGIYPRYGGMGDGTGFGGGVIFKRPLVENRLDWELGILASIKGYQLYGLKFIVPKVGTDKLKFGVGFDYNSLTEEEFFGLGNFSEEDDRTTYFEEKRAAKFFIGSRLVKSLKVGASAGITNSNIRSGRDTRFPSIEEVFEAEDIPGLSTRGAELISYGFFIDHDTRDIPGGPNGGGQERVSVTLFEDNDGDQFDYINYTVEIKRFISLSKRKGKRILAIRLLGVFNEDRNGGEVPFYSLTRLGGSRSLRGFRERRFFDTHALLLNLEYRYRLQGRLEWVLFLDEGQVKSNANDFKLSDFKTSYGTGLRFRTANGVAFRIELGISKEDTRFWIKFDPSF